MVGHWHIPEDLWVPDDDDDDPTCAVSRCADTPHPDSSTGLCAWHMGVEEGDE